MNRNKREIAEQKKTYLREFTKNDSQKALIDFNQSKLAPELLKEKQRLLQVVAEKNLEKMQDTHENFLNRYYDYKQTEMQDGPAVRHHGKKESRPSTNNDQKRYLFESNQDLDYDELSGMVTSTQRQDSTDRSSCRNLSPRSAMQ